VREGVTLIVLRPKQFFTLSEHHILDRFRHVALLPQINRAAVTSPGSSFRRKRSGPSQSSRRVRFKGIKTGSGSSIAVTTVCTWLVRTLIALE
jgi:hypothetical protein